MTANLAKLEAAMSDDPHDAAVRAVYADALLESGDTTRGELIALTARREAGDKSTELAVRVRQLEKEIERELLNAFSISAGNKKEPKFVLCQFRHGLVDRIELGGRWALGVEEGDRALAKFLKRPELMFLRGIDLRRVWPEQKKKAHELTAALPKIFRTAGTIEWLGLGPHAAADGKALDVLATTFPKLTGLALTCDEADPVLEALSRGEGDGELLAQRLIDFEIAGNDVEDIQHEKMVGLSPHLPNLERYVMFWETSGDDNMELLTPILAGVSFPTLTSLGVIFGDCSVNASFLTKLVKSKLFKTGRLKSIGLACDGIDAAMGTWLDNNRDAIAHIELFAAPSYVTMPDPEWDDARDDLATALHTIGRKEEALRLREALVIANPRQARFWDNLGDSLRESERHEEALIAFEKAIALDKNLDTAWSGKADSLSELNREKEALVAWNHAVKIYPRDAYSQNGRALTLVNLGRHEEALKGYKAAIESNEDFIPPYANRGDALMSMQRFADALKDYRRVLDAKDDDNAKDLRSFVLNRVGLIYLLNGDRENATKSFNQAIQEALAVRSDEEAAIDPRINLARMYVKANKHREALKIFDVLCKGEHAHWSDKHSRAWTLLEMGSAKEALASFENDCDLKGAAVERLFALEALGKKADALKELAGHRDKKKPMTGCLYRWVSESLLHALLLTDDEKTRAQALIRARATPHDPIKHFEALRTRAEKEKGKPQCDAVSCVTGSALIAVLAALLEDNEEEALARGKALANHLSSVDLMNELGLRWAVTRAARLAKLDERYPYVTSWISAAEVMMLPSKVILPKGPTTGKRATKTKKSR